MRQSSCVSVLVSAGLAAVLTSGSLGTSGRLAASQAPTPARNTPLATVVDAYLRVQTSLAADSTAGVEANAQALASAAQGLGASGADLTAAARGLSAARDLTQARDGFLRVTTALFAYADATKASLGPGVRRTYCPMEKKAWAQRQGQIANPYAGRRMLRCGVFTDTP